MQTTTSVPAYTLQAITRQLTDKKGVDITNIVNALAPGRDEDVVAVQVALLLNGYTQEATKHSRFGVYTSDTNYEPKTIVWRFDYKTTAVFDKMVYFDRVPVYVDVSNVRKGVSYEKVILAKTSCTSYDNWENNFMTLKEFNEHYPDLAASIEMGITKVEASDE